MDIIFFEFEGQPIQLALYPDGYGVLRESGWTYVCSGVKLLHDDYGNVRGFTADGVVTKLPHGLNLKLSNGDESYLRVRLDYGR